MAWSFPVKIFLFFALCFLGMAHATPAYRYRVTVLIPFTPGQGSGVATLINNHGLVCGLQGGSFKAFCWYRGTLTDLQPLPGDTITVALGINELNQVVGRSYSADGPDHAVVFVNGVAQPLAVSSHTNSAAEDINNLGQVVGEFSDVAFASRIFASWFGVVGELPALGGPRHADFARGNNDRGQVVGQVSRPGTAADDGVQIAFLHEDGITRALATPAGYSSNAVRINLQGQAVGSIQPYGNADGTRPVLWDKSGRRVLVDEAGDARDINNLGQVVGGIYNRTGGFLYHPATGARDLNTLIDPASGYTIVYPQAINDLQQIVGFGCKELLCGPVLLDPVAPHAAGAPAAAPPVMAHGERSKAQAAYP